MAASAIHDFFPAVVAIAHEGDIAAKATAAIYNLFPWVSAEFRAVSSLVGTLTTYAYYKDGIAAAAAKGSAYAMTERKIVRRMKWGIALLVLIAFLAAIHIPESWLPGGMALFRFWTVSFLAMWTNIVLASASGLEIGLFIGRR